MLILDNTKPNSPIYKWQPKPTFRSTYESEKYWAEQKKRWVEGYNSLPGSLYYYLQECWIKHRVIPQGHQSVERPIPRVASLWMHQEFQKTRNKKKVQGIIKARNVGLSTEGGALANYFSKVHPGSTSLITSKDQDGISVIFREKVYIPYQHLDKDIRPDELRRSDTKQHCHLRLGVTNKDDIGENVYSTSVIELRETSEKPKSPTNFSGQGAAYGFYDELPLHPRKEALLNSSIECYRNPFTKELDGFLLWGGTVESEMSNESVGELQKLINKKDVWDCEVLFIPYWWGMFLENGHPNKEKADEWWNREYEKVEKDPTKERAFKRNNPRTEEDIFESVKGTRWEDDVSEKIVLQKKKVLEADVPTTKCNLINNNGNVTFEVSKKGNTHILEHPKAGCTYVSLIDGTATGSDSGSEEGSNVAGIIVKLADPVSDPYMPVCIYTERPKTVEASYIRLVSQALYYNKFGGLKTIAAEANASTADHFATFLDKEGMLKYAMRRKDLSGKGWSDTNKIFQYRTPELIDFQYKQANIFLRKWIGSIQMLILLDQMLLPMSENADLVDAFLQLFVVIPDIGKPKVIQKPMIRPKPQGIYYINGVAYRGQPKTA